MIIKPPAQEQIPALRELWKEAFGDTDQFLDGFFRAGFSFDRCRCVLEQNMPVAVLYWFDCTWQGKKLAYIYAVATTEIHRGRGLCRALMTDTHNHLRTRNYAGTVLVPGSPALFRLYEKLSYLPFCPRQITKPTAAKTAVTVTPITADAYGKIRKKTLPGDSVWQDDATLAFLGTFAGFYAGEDFAFCGAVENNTLYIQEFMGNLEQIPGIIAHFNCESGELPVSDGAPYAMFHPLIPTDHLPVYFGIPLN